MDMAKAVAVAAIVASPLLAGATEGTNEVGAVRNRLFTLGRLLITCYHHILFLYVCVSIDLRSKLRQDLLFLHPHSCSRPFPRPCFQRLGKRSIKRGFLRRDRPSERLNAFIYGDDEKFPFLHKISRDSYQFISFAFGLYRSVPVRQCAHKRTEESAFCVHALCNVG